MKKNLFKKIFIFVILLISIINIGLIIKLFLDDTAYEIFTILGIITIVIQIFIIIISTIIIKRDLNNKKKNLLIILLIVFLIITFFIPIQMNYHYPHSGVDGLTPAVMPQKSYDNLYGISLYSSSY